MSEDQNKKHKKSQLDLFTLNAVLPSSWTELARILGFTVLIIILVAFAISALIGVLYLSDKIFNLATNSAAKSDDNFADLRNSLFILAALIGIPFFVWRTWIARRQSLSAEHQAETARDRAYTELFTKAIEQLGAEKPAKKTITGVDDNPITVDDYVPNIEVRIGAIYALERIMKDSKKDAAAVVDTLSAYVRENCGKATLECEIPKQNDYKTIGKWVDAIQDYVGDPWTPEEGSLVARAHALKELPQVNRADIKTALTVIGRRPQSLKDPKHFESETTEKPDLRDVNFQGWDLKNFDLSHCNLSGAKMQGASLSRAQMQGANLSYAQISEVQITEARKTAASVIWVDFTKAKADFNELQEQLPELFGHQTKTTLPKGMVIPDHWSKADMQTSEGDYQYRREWEDFKKKKGVE